MRCVRRPRPMVASLMWAALAVGCSAQHEAGYAAADTAAPEDPGGGDDAGGNDLGPQPTHWRLSATLVVADGSVVADQSFLDVAVDNIEEQELCQETGSLSTVLEADVQPPEFVAWYDVTVDAWEADCEELQSAVTGGSSFLLGLGELHPEALALLDTLEEAGDSAETSLNGAYASFDGGETAYIFGVGGTAEAFEGVGEAPTDGPLPDGTWLILPLYSFSL